MTGKNSVLYTVIIFVVIAVVVCVWLIAIAPVFQEKEKEVRSENAALVKDIAEIDAMNGNTQDLENRIAETEAFLTKKYSSRTDTASDAAGRIENIVAGLGLRTSKVAVAQEVMLHPAGTITPALYSVDITFLIESTEEAGAPVIRAIENYALGDFDITSFVFRQYMPIAEDEDEESEDTRAAAVGEWIFTATLYFYD